MKICRMFVFIHVQQQFYYIAKQGFLLRNSKVGYTRHFKSQDGCHVFKIAATVHFAKILDILNFEAKHCFFFFYTRKSV